MISVISIDPSPSALRALKNQDWEVGDELHLVLAQASPSRTPLSTLQAIDAFAPATLRVADPHADTERIPPWDSYINAMKASTCDWIWAFPPGAQPSPRGLAVVRRALRARNDAKIHIFRAMAQASLLYPPYPSRDVIAPRTITIQCAVVPRGAALRAAFHPGDWGDVGWLDEAIRLHPSGDDALVFHNFLIATRDFDRGLIEKRLRSGELLPGEFTPFRTPTYSWIFYLNSIESKNEPMAHSFLYDVTTESGEAVWGDIQVLGAMEGKGYRLPLIQFLLEAAAGAPLSLPRPASSAAEAALQQAGFTITSDSATHRGLCSLWPPSPAATEEPR